MLRSHKTRDNVERGTECGMLRDNVELQKLVLILVLYGVMVLKSMPKLVLKRPILCQNLTFKSAQGTVLY